MSGNLEVDVVIPVFNGERYIKECIESILSQTYPVKNIIVSDDGSTDNTADIVSDILQKHPNIKLLKSNHKGVSAARNFGITHSSSDLIAFLDSDDKWLPTKLEKQVQLFRQGNANLALVYCAYEMINEDNQLINCYLAKPTKRGNIFVDLLYGEYALSGSSSGVLIKKKYLDEVGYFDESLFFAEDADLWLRISKNYDCDFCHETLVQIRSHAKSVQNQNYKAKQLAFIIQQIMFYKKWETELLSNPVLFAKTKKEIRYLLGLSLIRSILNIFTLYPNIPLLLKSDIYNKNLFVKNKWDIFIFTTILAIKLTLKRWLNLFCLVPKKNNRKR